MAIIATAQPDNVPPRVQITISGLTDTSVTVNRRDPDGKNRPVRTAEPAALTGGAWIGYDYEMPLGVPVTYTFSPAPVNLLTTNQASLETNTTGWAAVGGTNSAIARVTTTARDGSASLSLVSTVGGAAYATTPRTTAGMPAVAGETYTASAWFKAGVSAKSAAVAIVWLNSSGTQIGSTVFGSGVNDSTTEWTQTSLTATAPATTTYAAITVLLYSATANQAHYIDSISFRQVAESTVTVTAGDGWLVNPGVPSLSVRLTKDSIIEFEDRTRPARAAVLQPLGRSKPIVVSEVRSSVQSGITVVTDTISARDNLWGALDAGSTLLLNLPSSWNFGVSWEYISIGDAVETPLARGLNTARRFTLPYTVVDRPVGAVQSQWTYTGVSTAYATYAEMQAAYGTYTDVMLNTPL